MGHANTAFLPVWQKTEIVFYIELYQDSRCFPVRCCQIAVSTLLPHVHVTWHMSCVSSWSCVTFCFCCEGELCSGQPVHLASVLVSIIELKFLQSMSGSVTNQRKVNNVQAGCDQSLLTNPRPQSELTDQWWTGGSGWGVVMVRPLSCHTRHVDVSVPVLTCAGQDWRHVQVMTSLKGAGPDQVCTSQPVTGATKWKSEAEMFYDKTLHWHWSLSVVCAGPWSLVM